ncbi:MAG: phage tail assembly chaperone [Alphaproteobacteria bacterium]
MWEEGRNIKALEEKPILLEGSAFYFRAFLQLRSDRPVGMSIGSIPYSSVVAWCHHNHVKREHFEFVFNLIRVLDKVELEHKKGST